MNLITFLKIFLGLAVWGWPGFLYADPDHHENWGHHGIHHYYHYHDRPHWGIHVDAFYPDEYYPVWTGGARYYYDDGVYYDYVGGNYEVVAPPIGAVISTVPSDFQPVVINGLTYYTDNGTYYVHTSNGYKVVSPPLQAPSLVDTQNIFTVNVPNAAGGYTTVTIKKSGNGFVGPQGEFYPQFPDVSQLRNIYGK